MNEVIAEAMLGRDAEEFINSDLGQFMLGCVQQEIDTAQEQLKRVHPWRTRRIRDLQNQIWRAESFVGWLSELVIRGKQAMQSIEEE